MNPNSSLSEPSIGVEEGVLQYLSEFSDTREADILQYIVNEHEYSKRGAKKLIKRMEKDKRIFRIVHVKLRPPAVYYSSEKYIPLEIQKELIRAEAQIKAAEFMAYQGK